jgi:hypothetical protein
MLARLNKLTQDVRKSQAGKQYSNMVQQRHGTRGACAQRRPRTLRVLARTGSARAHGAEGDYWVLSRYSDVQAAVLDPSAPPRPRG